MTFVMNARVTFPEHNGRKALVMRKISEVHTYSSRKTKGDTAEIVLPRNIKFFENEVELNRKDIKKIFRIGDPVIIEMCYGADTKLIKEFSGYISAPVSAETAVITIKCEDEMYFAKKGAVNYSSPDARLPRLLKDILPGYEIDAEDVSLGMVRLSRTNVGAVLEKLTQNPWNLNCYMRGKTLYVEGKERENIGTVKIDMERDLIDDSLQYRESEQVIVKVKATSVLVNGEKIEYTIGEDGGDSVNLTYYNIVVPAEIEKLAKADYSRLKKGGFDGGIKGFGEPSVQHGMVVELVSDVYPDRNGRYYADTVNKHFVPAEYTQEITLGRRA